MDDLELQISQINVRLEYGNCGFAFTQAFSAEAMAHACNRFPDVRQWWDTRINSGDQWSYGYLDSTWKVVHARINCLKAQEAVQSVFDSGFTRR